MYCCCKIRRFDKAEAVTTTAVAIFFAIAHTISTVIFPLFQPPNDHFSLSQTLSHVCIFHRGEEKIQCLFSFSAVCVYTRFRTEQMMICLLFSLKRYVLGYTTCTHHSSLPCF